MKNREALDKEPEMETGMTEVIYFDIDGTLRDEKQGLPDSVCRAITKCREKGILIVICTGRNEESIQEDVKALNADGVISGDGCGVRWKQKVLKHIAFSIEIVQEILEEVKGSGSGASFESDNSIYMNAEAALFYKEDFEKKICGDQGAEKRKEENRIFYENNISQLWKEIGKVHKVCLIGDGPFIEAIKNKFNGVVEISQIREWNHRMYLEMLPPGSGKGRAVKFLNEYLNIRKENSMSFGDGENDVGMLLESGIGIAVKGCSEKLLRYADSVCGSPAEDGIYRELIQRKIIDEDIERTVKKSEKEKRYGNGKTLVAKRGDLSDLSEKLL
ncbi:MAG: HAD family hydrolase [Clostridiales bacterium]|nr:HAD family hydrolase [Clostridiales bacterium]